MPVFEFESVDELPPGGRGTVSDFDLQIETYINMCDIGEINNKTEDGRSVWTVIKTGENKESMSAATSQLKDKYGDVTCKGLSFACRPWHRDNTNRAIYMCYEPEKIIEGHYAEHDKKRKARIKLLNERAAERKAAKAASEVGPTDTGPVSTSTPATKKG
jgi:hypothetical protein